MNINLYDTEYLITFNISIEHLNVLDAQQIIHMVAFMNFVLHIYMIEFNIISLYILVLNKHFRI